MGQAPFNWVIEWRVAQLEHQSHWEWCQSVYCTIVALSLHVWGFVIGSPDGFTAAGAGTWGCTMSWCLVVPFLFISLWGHLTGCSDFRPMLIWYSSPFKQIRTVVAATGHWQPLQWLNSKPTSCLGWIHILDPTRKLFLVSVPFQSSLVNRK